MSLPSIGFGGGCHWCTEAVFQALRGVEQVAQGYIRSIPPHDNFSEAVVVRFDPDIIPLTVLIDIHLRTHSSTSNHKMRGKYRSAIYVFSDAQSAAARDTLVELQHDFDETIVTQVLRHVAFKASDDRFINYQQKNAQSPFCTRYIDPKLDVLRDRFGERVNSN